MGICMGAIEQKNNELELRARNRKMLQQNQNFPQQKQVIINSSLILKDISFSFLITHSKINNIDSIRDRLKVLQESLRGS